jgi:hypothetical protein
VDAAIRGNQTGLFGARGTITQQLHDVSLQGQTAIYNDTLAGDELGIVAAQVYR